MNQQGIRVKEISTEYKCTEEGSLQQGIDVLMYQKSLQ